MSKICIIDHTINIKKIDQLGKGSYGFVYKSSIDGKEVAIKRNLVDNITDHYGNIRELELLMRLNNHPYIVNITHLYKHSNIAKQFGVVERKGVKDDNIHFVFPLAKYDGSYLLKHYRHTYNVLKIIMTQMLLAIEYMHAKGIIHRDLKLNNTLWYENDGKCKISITDLGLSKIMDNYNKSTPKVVTHWYRAPEIMITKNRYDEKSDIWSLACIFYELIKGHALLEKYETDNDILNLEAILKLVPSIKNDNFKNLMKEYNINMTTEYPNYGWNYFLNLSTNNKDEFNKKGGTVDEFLDLLKNMFELYPNDRYSATQALNHRFFDNHRELINNTRKLYPPIRDSLPLYIIPDTKYKSYIAKLVYDIYVNRHNHKWYNHKILFLSVDILHRYINSLEQDTNLLEENLELIYYVSLYISIKYFTSMTCPISFENLIPTKLYSSFNLNRAYSLEYILLNDVLKWNIYRMTLVEVINLYKETSLYNNFNNYIDDLLRYYLSIEKYNGSNLNIFVQFFKDKNIDLPDINLSCYNTIIPDSWPILDEYKLTSIPNTTTKNTVMMMCYGDNCYNMYNTGKHGYYMHNNGNCYIYPQTHYIINNTK